MESSRSAEVIPAKSDRSFNDYPGVVSREARYRFNHELAQFEPLTSKPLEIEVDSSNDSSVASGVLKVRIDDRGPGQSVAEEHRGSDLRRNSHYHAHRTSTPVNPEEPSPTTRQQAQPNEQPKPDPINTPSLPALVRHRFCDCHDCYFDCLFEDPLDQISREEWHKIPILSTSYSDRVQKWRRQTAATVGRLASVL